MSDDIKTFGEVEDPQEETTLLATDETEVQESQDAPPPPPPSRTGAPKNNWPLYITAALLVIALLIMGYLLFIKEKAADDGSEQIRQMQELTQNIQTLESDVKQKQDEMFALMNEYKEKTGEPFTAMGVNPLDLSDEEKKLMEQKIRDEKDVSLKSLLEEINDKDNDIRDLKKKVKEIEALLPKPHIVKSGENHYQVAMDFLLNEKKLDKKKAIKLVERTALIDPMLPGFKVWNFYTGDAYGSSVTQGTASVSPNTVIRAAKKKLVDARDEAISQRDKLTEDIKTLEEKRAQIIQQVDMLANEKESLIGKVTDLNEQVNSLFYLLDRQRNLKKKGIIKAGFLRSPKLRKVSPEDFTEYIDLRTQTDIAVSAEDMGLKKIKAVTFYPKFYKKGADYKIAIAPDKQSATVTILDTAKFKNERIVLSVK